MMKECQSVNEMKSSRALNIYCDVGKMYEMDLLSAAVKNSKQRTQMILAALQGESTIDLK